MQLLPLLVHRGRSRARVSALPSFVAIGLFLAVVMPSVSALGQQFQVWPRRTLNSQEAAAGVYLPNDRTQSRAIERARERLKDHEYQEVLGFLQQILARDEDAFLESAGDDHQQLGLKATARQMIGELPPEGYQAYELLHGATARRQLQAAIRSGDREALADVVRNFFHTSAGYEAALVLAQKETDEGHRLAAAELYRELIEAPRAAARFEPQLSIAAGLNLLAAGQADDAAATLRALVKNNPSAQVMVAGKTTSLSAASADPIGWLTSLVGQLHANPTGEVNWLTLHGDASRNSQSAGGRPHLRPRWEARVVNDPSIESYLSGRSDDFLQRGVAVIPAARPIAVGDVVVMRTPENIVAINWQTGKRIWETREDAGLDSDLGESEPTPGVDREQLNAQGKSLDERIWDDALMNSLASDGKRVFVVRGMAVAPDDEAMSGLQAQLFARNGIENVAATNQLAAYDIATQGKLVWELDGGRNIGKVTGAFFLGAPLAIDNTLYVMVEIRSALYLVALDPATGQVQWQQQLLGLEQGIALDPTRRQVSAMPSYAGGILVCPTAASTVVGIDVVKREFAWVYRYPPEAQSAAEMRNWQLQQMHAQLVRANNKWLDSSAVIAEGRVLLTPPDSSELHCVDLRSGKLLWKRRQGDALFIGCVDNGNVLLVGGQSLEAMRLSDGGSAWDKETLPLPTGLLPAGQGYLSDGRYYLPLTSGQVAAIDIADGKLTTFSPSGTDVALGNLICYRGSVISQSPLVLDKFEQLDALRRRTDAALARNPNDATAIRELAELKSAENQRPEAVRLLKRAYELAPDDLVTQEMLVELLLQELSADYASFHEDVPLAAKLIHSRDQRVELLRIDAAGLDALGQRLAAFDAYLRLADFTSEEPTYLRIEDQYTVRSDRWISGRLAALWAGASADERKTIEKELAARRPALDNPRTAAELRHYLAHLANLPGADEVRLAMARYLVEHGRPQEAELELLQLLASGDQETQAGVSRLMAKLTAKTDGKTDRPPTEWPHGHVDAELASANVSPTIRDRAANPPNPGASAGYRPLRIEQDFWPQASSMQWFVSLDCSEIIGRNIWGDDVFHLAVDQNSLARQYRDSNLVHGARLGHLLYVALGGQVMAIDSRQDHPTAEGDLLWPPQAQDAFDREPARPRRGPSANQVRTNRPPLYHFYGRKRMNGAAGIALGSLGPVTPRGVVFQDDNELKCVDPLTGITLWARTDIPLGCELFGDGELVFAADVGGKDAYVMRLTDGQLLGKRDRPKPEWLLTAGGNVAQLASGANHGNRYLLSVSDVWAQKTLCQIELPNTAKFSVIEPNAVAVFDPAGQFRLIDVQSGRLIVDERLDAVPDAQAIHTMPAGDNLFVFITGQIQSQVRPLGQPFDYPIINGPVYAFNMKTGKQLWPGPALVRNRGVYLSQPADVPFLVFADRKFGHNAATGGSSQLRVLCLDKRTGETVYRNDQVPDSSVPHFSIRAENVTHPVVSLELGAAKIQLTLTDRPRPPQPPANDDLEGSREIVERGLRGLGLKLGDALPGALKSGSSNTPRQPQTQNKRPNSGSKPAKESTNTPDDD